MPDSYSPIRALCGALVWELGVTVSNLFTAVLSWELPGSPVFRTQHFQYRGPTFSPLGGEGPHD